MDGVFFQIKTIISLIQDKFLDGSKKKDVIWLHKVTHVIKITI
jgi:hypothetical protein